jgi:hypothetical protein
MKKSGQETAMFGIPMPAMELLQPQAILDSCGKVSAQIEDLSRTMMGSMQRNVDAAWELTAQLARSGSATDATRLYREWLDERRDAFIADGKQISNMWFKLCEVRPMPSAGTAATVPMARSASAAE